MQINDEEHLSMDEDSCNNSMLQDCQVSMDDIEQEQRYSRSRRTKRAAAMTSRISVQSQLESIFGDEDDVDYSSDEDKDKDEDYEFDESEEEEMEDEEIPELVQYSHFTYAVLTKYTTNN